MTRHRQLANAATWGLLDQAIYSAGSLLLGVTAAGSASADQFGFFAIAFLVAVFSIAISRAVAGQPMTILFADVPEPQWRRATAQMLAFIAALALVLGVAVAGLGLAFVRASPSVFVALGAAIPAVLIQDGLRYALFSDGRRATAVAADLIWLAVQVSGTFVLWLAGANTPTTLILVWGVGAAMSALWASHRIRIGLIRLGTKRWREAIEAIWRPLVIDALLTELPRQAGGWAVTAAAGTRAVGSMRGAEILFGPVTTTAGGIRIAFVPIASSEVRNQHGTAMREGLVASGIIAAVAALSLLIWASIPDSVGVQVLGSTWASASTLVVALGISLIFQAGGVGGQVRLLGNVATSSVAKRRAVVAAIQATASVLGAIWGGALGAIVGLAAANAIGLVIWWLPIPVASGPALNGNE